MIFEEDAIERDRKWLQPLGDKSNELIDALIGKRMFKKQSRRCLFRANGRDRAALERNGENFHQGTPELVGEIKAIVVIVDAHARTIRPHLSRFALDHLLALEKLDHWRALGDDVAEDRRSQLVELFEFAL